MGSVFISVKHIKFESSYESESNYFHMWAIKIYKNARVWARIQYSKYNIYFMYLIKNSQLYS